ncbi:hypothetical protein D9M73_130780 [compost metagenome]
MPPSANAVPPAVPGRSPRIWPASPNARLAPNVDRSPKSPKLDAAAARERVPNAEACASNADACPSAVPIGAAAAVAWPATPRDPDVNDVNTLPLKRNTVKTNAPARPAAAVRKLPKIASAFIAAEGASSQALAASAFERSSASVAVARPSVS